MKFPINTEIEINLSNIRTSIEQRLAHEVTNRLKRDYVSRYDSGTEWSADFTACVKDAINEFMEENKTLIIEETVKTLTKRLANTKAVKDKLAIILEGIDD